MIVPRVIIKRDKQIDALIDGIVGIVRKKGLERDRRGWFANNQLDNLRQLLEKKGYKEARIYQLGKTEKGGNPFERAKNETLLDILDIIGDTKNVFNLIDLMTCSYILGKLNPILDEKIGGVRR